MKAPILNGGSPEAASAALNPTNTVFATLGMALGPPNILPAIACMNVGSAVAGPVDRG